MTEFQTLMKDIFSDKKAFYSAHSGMFKASKFETVIKQMLENKLGNGRGEAKMIEEGSGGCKTQVHFLQVVELSAANKTPKICLFHGCETLGQ